MNKKEYIALMQEYEAIMQDKHFNLHFYNKERLEELKILINRQLSFREKRCALELTQFRYRKKRQVRLFSSDYELQLMEAMNMYVPLMEKIEREESIQGYEYQKCYIEWHYGPLKLKHVAILSVIYGFVMIVRWCLGYLGLLS